MVGQEYNTLNINVSDEYNSGTNAYVPFNGQFDYNQPTYSQFIIPAYDLASMQYGEIQSMTFFISKDPYGYGYPGEMPNWNSNDDQFQIFFAEVDDETFLRNDSWEYELYNESEMTLAFDSYQFGDNYELSEDDDNFLVTFYFNSNYTSSFYQYNGGNLLVYIKPSQFNNPYYGCYWLGVPQYQGGGYKNGDGPAAIYFNGDYVEEQQFRPMMTIEYTGGEAPSCPAPQDFEATPYAHGVTLTWTTDASKVNIQYKKSSDWDWTTGAENLDCNEWGYSYDLYGLNSETDYDVQIQAVCSDEYGNEEYSEWSMIMFTTNTPSAPTNLRATNYDTPEATTATLNWEGDTYDTPVYWDIAYTTDMSVSPDNSTIITISSDDYYNSYDMTGLTPLATYKVWIRSNFGSGEVSDWSEPCTFRPTNWENVTANQGYTTNSVIPFRVSQQSSSSSKSQFIVASDKLNELFFHEIKKIKFAPYNQYFGGATGFPTATIQVYLKEVTDSEFATNTYYNWEEMELVYEGTFSQTQTDLVLDAPYYYTGGNLLVGVCATTQYNSNSYCSRNYWYGITDNNKALYSIGNGNPSKGNFLPQASFYYDPTEVSSCLSPANLTATATTSTTATLDWTPNGEEEAWDIYYTTDAAFTPDESTMPSFVATNQRPYTITGLSNETTYYTWVRANCGGSQSHWSQGCLFITTDRVELTLNDGTATVYSPIYSNYGDDYKKQLLIPAFELETMTNGDVQRLIFYSITENKIWSNQFKIYLAEIGTNAIENEYDWKAMNLVYQGSLSVDNHLLTIVFDTPYKYEGGNLLIGITSNGNVGTITWYGTGDWQSGQPKTTFSYLPGAAPAIARPQGLVATNITEGSAELSWTDMDGMSWNLRYKTAEASEWTIVTPNSNVYRMTDLSANTTYRVQVQASDGESQSSWSYLEEFRTLCDIIVVDAESPYTNDFGTDPMELCWIADESSYYYDGSYVQFYGENSSASLWMPSMHIDASNDEIVCLSFESSSDGMSLCSVFVNDTPIWESTDFEYNTLRRVFISLNDFRGQDVSVKFQVSNGYWNLYDVFLGINLPVQFDNLFETEGEWNNPGNWSTGDVPSMEQNVLLMAPATVSSGTVAYANSITPFYGQGSITIANGGQVHCNNDFEGTIEKEISGYGEGDANWYLIAIPHSKWENEDYVGIGVVEVENLIDEEENNYDFYKFNPNYEGEEWRNYKSKDPDDEWMSKIQRVGFLYANKYNTTLRYSGLLNVHSITLQSDYYSEEKPWGKWNLTGNPMLCNAYISDGRDFYRMNEEGSAIVLADESNGGNAIKPCEGVFTVSNYAYEPLSYTSIPPTSNKHLDFSLSMNQNDGGDAIDRVRIRFDKEQLLEKLTLMSNPNKIYFPIEGKDYAVVNAGTIGEMPLNFEAAENGRYTISVDMKEVEMSYLHLVDNLTGDDVDLLATPSHSFDAKTTDYASRFKVVFATGSSADTESFAFINGSGNLCIFGIDGEATVQVIDMLGHVISSETFNGSYEKKMDGLPGVYVLRLINGDDVKVQKVVVR